MRIVITKNGKIIVRELEDESPNNNKFGKTNLKYNQSSSYTKLPIVYSSNEELFKKYNSKNNEFLRNVRRYRETFQSKRSSSVVDKNVLESFYNRDESKVNLKELNQAKMIKISHPKMNMSQAFIDKYDNFDSNYKSKLSDLNYNLSNNMNVTDKQDEKNINEINKNIDNNKNMEHNFQFSNMNMNYDTNLGMNSSTLNSGRINRINLGKIISANNLINLRNQISKYNKGHEDVRYPLNEQNMKSFNFRSKYENKQATEEDMDLFLNYSINPDKANIIKYFQQNKKISPQYFENLVKYDEAKLYKLNKICQLIFHRQENEDKNLDLKYYELNKENDKFDREKGSRHLKDLRGIVDKSNSILDDYNIMKKNYSFWRKNLYKEEVMKIKKKYWDKYNVDRYLKNRQKEDEMGIAQSTKNSSAFQINKKLIASQSTPEIYHQNKI